MPDLWAADASPVILLHRVGRLDLLGGLGTGTFLPLEVIEEVSRGPAAIPLSALRAAFGLTGRPLHVLPDDDATSGRTVRMLAADLTALDVTAPAPPALRARDLGPGATAARRVALQGRVQEYGAVLDDLQARRTAASLGVAVVGTLGIVMRAKRRGIVESARRLFGELRAAGLFATDEFLEAAARDVGE